MKTLLIAEDEKMIRRGIRAIVERAELEIAEVLECKNGREALDILESRPVDVLIADIQMPVMDGLELVRRVSKLPNPPLVVVISGYDKFAYAVGMLREGVRDYLLKPVNREKLVEVLAALDRELAVDKTRKKNRIITGKHLLRALLLEAQPAEPEACAIQEQLGEILLNGRYRVLCLPAGAQLPASLSQGVIMPNMNGHLTLLDVEDCLNGLQECDFATLCAGVSGIYSGVDYLRTAFLEAEAARGAAFLLGSSVRFQPGGKQAPHEEPEGRILRIIHLFGANNLEGVKQALGQLVMLAQNGQISPALFSRSMELLVKGLENSYPGALSPQERTRFICVWNDTCAYAYYMALCGALEAASHRLQLRHESKNKRRIAQAVIYLQEHFREDVDMMQLSSHVSMNYAQFSYLFKRQTGTGFLDYLKALRLDESKRLLRETNLRIRAVSEESGFKSDKHFMKVFKEVVGVSPGEYRKSAAERQSHIVGGSN